jgi:carboxypeptidase family protein
VVATAPPGPAEYLPLQFDLAVQGASVVRSVDLYPPSESLVGIVLSATTGAGIPGATVAVRGTALDGAVWVGTTSTNGTGGFAIAVYSGSYELFADAPGYAAVSLNLTVGRSTGPVRVDLAPEGSVAAAAASSWELPAGVGVGLLALAVLLLVSRRFRRPPDPTPIYPAPDPGDEPEGELPPETGPAG